MPLACCSGRGQFGTTFGDSGDSVVTDALGNVYVKGGRRQPGRTLPGAYDAFVTKYDAAGNLQWVTQFGTNGSESGSGVAVDDLGNVYVAADRLYKFDAAGSLLWTKYANIRNSDVSLDGLGNIYVSGSWQYRPPGDIPRPAFVKFDTAGNLQWSRHVINGVGGGDIAADGLGHVYLTALTDTQSLSLYDGEGNLQWTEPVSGPYDGNPYPLPQISTDGSGDVVVAVNYAGNAFLSKYDAAGTRLWSRHVEALPALSGRRRRRHCSMACLHHLVNAGQPGWAQRR